jgi:DNA-binding beta-propeller fold protein YncE
MMRHTPPWTRGFALFVALTFAVVVSACSAGDPASLGQQGSDPSPSLGDDGLAGAEGEGGTTEPPANEETRAWGDDPEEPRTEPGAGDGTEPGDPRPGSDPTGGLGDPCSDGDDCTSGWCLPGPNGPTCSIPCTDSCPDGWECKELESSGGDPVYICVDPTARLCHPCLQDADCNQGLGASHRCVDFGDSGKFCGLGCEGSDSSCPQGMACQDAGDTTNWQCIPSDGESCTCNNLAKALALKTTCSVTNDSGSCPGWRTCEAEGLSECAAPTPMAEVCNGIDDDCDGQTDNDLAELGEPCDVQGDWGSCAGTTVCEGGGMVCIGTPASAESCNGLDDDCDGAVDESYADHDADGDADCLDADDDNDGVEDGEDCSPFAPTIFPDAPELCNGLDDDCDDEVDEPGAEGCTDRYRDIDGDGYGDLNAPMVCLCLPNPASYYTATVPGDCDDLKPQVNPGEQDICDGLDNDCDGLTDELTNLDTDGDGIPDCADPDDDNDTYLDEVDCGSVNPTIYPGAPEVCNGTDDDCDGQNDEQDAEGCTAHWLDVDEDGWGDDTQPSLCLCGPQAGTQYQTNQAGDCNDLNGAVYPTAEELCNGIDDDCDDQVDEDGSKDTDGDGVADCVDLDDDGDGWPDIEDCAPLNSTRHPGAVEVCNALDDDCDGVPDPLNAEGCWTYWLDGDGDGYGSALVPPHCTCGPDPGGLYVVLNGDDCDDGNAMANPAAEEICNYLDDNCDGDADEGVSSPCGGCSPTCVLEVGTEDNPYDSGEAETGNVTPTEDGGITLASNSFEFPFIWVANSNENSVSKMNTETGCEVARYAICANPSRTAVDLEGNGLIACRDDGHIGKVAVLELDCIDKNGNGVIDTSRDLDGNCQISSEEMVAQDECILWLTPPDGGFNQGCPSTGLGCARAAGVDAENYVWVGMWNSMNLHRLHPQTGSVVKTIKLNLRPYGLAIDGDGIIWVASRSPHALGRVHPETGQTGSWNHPSNHAYGLAIDPFGKVWIAGGESASVARFDPDTSSFMTFNNLAPGNTRGVAVRIDKDEAGEVQSAEVYMAHHAWSGCNPDGTHRTISVIDAMTLQQKPDLDLGHVAGPVGVAVDSLGYVWSVNQCSSSASKIDPETGQVIGNYPVGNAPYTYSDMTGYALKTVTTDQGFYRETFTGWPGSETLWDSLVVEADLPGDGATWLEVSYRLANTAGDLAATPWNGPHGPYPPESFPLNIGQTGNHLEVRLTLGTSDPTFLPTLKKFTVIAFEQ